ncbi:hypothetical protein HDU91_002815, partial [Kappamyces sp. JEL0680]
EIRTLYEENPVHQIVRDQSKSESILGFEWIFPGELLVLSNNGIEFFQVDVHSRFTKQKSVKIHMNWYQYWPDTKLLVISSGTLNLFIYRILPKSSFEIFPTLSVQLKNTNKSPLELLSLQITRRHVHGLSFYGHNYAGVLNHWLPVPTLSLYRITTKTSYRKEHELQLQSPGEFLFTCHDNLLFAHNMSCSSTLVFDLKSSCASHSLVDATGELFQYLDGLLKKKGTDEDQLDWATFYPSYVLSPLAGKVFSVTPNLEVLLDKLYCRLDMSPLKATEFLIRRTDKTAYALRTRPLCRAISKKSDVKSLRGLFDCLCAHYEVGKGLVVTRASSVDSLSSGFSSALSLGFHHPVARDLDQQSSDGERLSFQ